MVPPMDEHLPADRSDSSDVSHDDSLAWAAIATLVGGPLTWGGIGWLVDRWIGSGRTCTAVGVIVGFIGSIYVVYMRYGRMSGRVGEDE